MKNLKYLLAAALFAPLFMSCDPAGTTDPQFGAATITFNNDEIQVIKGVLTPAIAGTITAPYGAIIESISVSATYTDGADVIDNLSLQKGLTYVSDSQVTFSYTEDSDGIFGKLADLTKIQIEVQVYNGEASAAAATVEFVSAADTPLSAEKSLEWKRAGGPATGMSEFGLAWTSNGTSGDYAIIKKDAGTKLVQLTAEQWTSIETVEALKAAVDAAASIDEYKGISTQKADNYNVVLAVNVGGDYKIIHITKCAIQKVNATDYTFTITGQYKDGNLQPVDK